MKPAATVLILLCGAHLAGAQAADAHQSVMICTNPASGAHWQIRIDYDRGKVGAAPARIGEDEIAWHDESDGGDYTLDRRSGELTVTVASSTGGYFLHDRCSAIRTR